MGLRFVTVTVESTSRAGYYPGACPMTVKMLAERRTGRLLGVQIVGREGAGKRVDIAAVALTAGMTVEQMTALDLGYAPPFSPGVGPGPGGGPEGRREGAGLLAATGPFRDPARLASARAWSAARPRAARSPMSGGAGGGASRPAAHPPVWRARRAAWS